MPYVQVHTVYSVALCKLAHCKNYSVKITSEWLLQFQGSPNWWVLWKEFHHPSSSSKFH